MILLPMDTSSIWPMLVVNLTVVMLMNRTLTDGNVNVLLVTWEIRLVFVLKIVLFIMILYYTLVLMMSTLVVVLKTIPMVYINIIRTGSLNVIETVILVTNKNILYTVKMVQIIICALVKMVGITILWVISTLKE